MSQIPKSEWMQVHEIIILNQVLSNQATNDPSSLAKLNREIQRISSRDIILTSSNTLIAIAWMTVARAYEIVNKHLVDNELQIFYDGVIAEFKIANITSYDEMKTKYNLKITHLEGENPNNFQKTFWNVLIKHLRNSLSHIDYTIDETNGTLGHQVIIKFHHSYNNTLKLAMEVNFSDFILFIEHVGVWIDTALQKNNLIDLST